MDAAPLCTVISKVVTPTALLIQLPVKEVDNSSHVRSEQLMIPNPSVYTGMCIKQCIWCRCVAVINSVIMNDVIQWWFTMTATVAFNTLATVLSSKS